MKLASIQHYQDRYQINHTENGKEFLKWDEKSDLKTKDQDFSWGAIFEGEPYLRYENDSKGQLFPKIIIFSYRVEPEEIKGKYDSFQKKLGLSKPPVLAEISQLHNYRNMVLTQLNEGLKKLEKNDHEIQSVLKVFLFEAVRQAEDTEYDSIKKVVKEFYRSAVRRFCVPDLIVKHYIPYYIGPITVDDTIKESSIEGILYYINEKDRIINKLLPVFEKFIFLEAIITQLLNDGKLENAKPEMSVDDATNELQKRFLKERDKNKPERAALIQVAIQIIYEDGSGKPKEYFDKGGWPLKKKLWDHAKVRKMKYVIPPSTRKNWLVEAYSEGKIRPPEKASPNKLRF